ncbi:unnamed protein product [Hymenolepis diminuta]|uniref:Large ribosomal subunit protein mL40 n=1 Tax=Hymenolepis diminuta TaxID=6216 RepID=A0A0R3SPE1_HYMDI|nr:unnamed protein product [Hymenolepis diminuta]
MFRSLTKFITPFVSCEISLVECFRGLHVSSILCAEPLKKKKRVDPQQEANRIRRKAKRIEREIKRLAKQGKKLKPVEEIEGDRQLMKEEKYRRREPVSLTDAEIDTCALLMKKWARYQAQVTREENQKLQRVQAAQQRALRCLAEISPHHLYKAAISPVSEESNGKPLLLHAVGPYATPPPYNSKAYEAPDGEKVDRTPTFEYEFELDRKFLAEAKKAKFVKVVGKTQVTN